MNKLTSLWRGGFFSIIGSGTLAKMTGFLTSIVVVRILTKAEYAALAYADNIYGYITLFAGLGMASAVLKYCVDENDDKNRAYYVFAFQWGTAFQVVSIITMLCVFSIVDVPFEKTKSLLIALAPYGFLFYWSTLFQSFLRTRFENRAYAHSNLIQTVSALLLTICFTRFFGILGLAVARFVAQLISILLFVKIVYTYYDQTNSYKLQRDEIIPFIEMSISLLISNLFSMMMPMNESFIVNNLIADEVTSANYRVANLIPSQLPFVTSIIVIYFFPTIAKLNANAETFRRIRSIGIGTFFVVLLICVVGYIGNPIIISHVYGDMYSDAVVISAPLWIVYFVNAGFRMIPMNMIPALGFARFNATISILTGVLHFLLCYFSVMRFGMFGGIYVRLFINFVTGLVYWFYLFYICKSGSN